LHFYLILVPLLKLKLSLRFLRPRYTSRPDGPSRRLLRSARQRYPSPVTDISIVSAVGWQVALTGQPDSRWSARVALMETNWQVV